MSTTLLKPYIMKASYCRPFATVGMVKLCSTFSFIFLMVFFKTIGQQAVTKDEPGQQWAGFRGTLAGGVFDNADLPENWSVKETKNVKWIVGIPGLGLSCPVIWENKVFVTSAISRTDSNGIKTGIYGDIESVGDNNEHEWKTFCFDKNSGKLIWEKTAYSGVPKVRRHPKSTHANCTVTTDGRYVVSFFGSEGLYCYDMDGGLKWKKDFGILRSAFFSAPSAEWEFASSPILYQSRVIVQCDVLENSFLAAMDAETGNELWKVVRNDYPGWATPNIYLKEGRPIVVVNGFKQIGGYDFETGKEVWNMSGGGDIPIPTPVIGNNLIYFNSAHGKQSPIFAVKKEAIGDISLAENQASNEFVAWSLPRAGSYMQTMILYEGLLYSCDLNGGISCFDAETGQRIYRNKLGAVSSFTASPVIADHRLYITDDEGMVYMVQTGREFKLLNTSSLGDVCMTSPAIAKGLMIFRTQHSLIAVGK
jgi:outer membrane protein assembly factor BamB